MTVREGKKDRLRGSAISALMTAPTLAAAAAQSGVSESTLARWLKDTEFAGELRQAQTDLIASSSRILAAAMPTAAGVLVAAMDESQPMTVRLSAARLLLTEGITLHGITVISRQIAELQADDEQEL